MSGQLIGQAIGSYFFGPWGGLIGGMIGGMLDPQAEGPRLGDLKAQASEYGRPIPIVYGTAAVGGNVIWASDLVEEEGEGGKGGGGGAVPYVYFANFAVALCEGPVALGRIWAGPDKRLIWDGFKLEGSESGAVMRFYPGSETQLPDALIESYEGVGNVPPYRGTAYLVFEHFPVINDGNRIPFLTVEAGSILANTGPANISFAWMQQVIVTSTFYAVVYNGSYEGVIIRKLSDDTLLKHFTYAEATWSTSDLWFWDETRQVFVRTRGADGKYQTINYSNGLVTDRVITAHASAEADAAPTSNIIDGVYHNGQYVFIAKGNATKRVTLFVMDPATHSPVATYTSTMNGDIKAPLMKPTGASPWVYAHTGAPETIVQYGIVPATAPITIGSSAPGYLTTSIHSLVVDPATGYIWTMTQASGGVTKVRVLNPATQTTVFSDDRTSLVTLSNFVTFIPGSPGKVAYYGQGGYLNACDSLLLYTGGTTPAFLSETVTSFATGGYAGTSDIHIVMYNPTTLGLTAFRRNGGVSPGTTADPVLSLNWMEPNTWDAAADTRYLAEADGNLAPQGQLLSSVVQNLSVRAGLALAQINVTALADDTVDGYVIANQVPVHSAISALVPAYYFDAVEDNGVVKFVKRGGLIAVVIPDNDLGAYDSGGEPVDQLLTQRQMENELPRVFNVNYVLEATAYSPAHKHAIRLIGASGDEQALELPMVLTDTKAQQVAEVNLHAAWVARLTYKFSLPRKYAYLEPTDIIQVEDYTVRLARITQSDGVLRCEAVHDESNVYLPRVIVTETPPTDQVVFEPSVTILELM